MIRNASTGGAGPDDEASEIIWEIGMLVSDTHTGVRVPGTRSLGEAERRLLFEGDGVYTELRFPIDAGQQEDGAWVWGQFIVPEAKAEKYDLPMLAVLQNQHGVTGAIRMSEGGEFALPFRGEGKHTLEFESRDVANGHGFRVVFTV